MDRWKKSIGPVLLTAALLTGPMCAAQQKDYLTSIESDKIRDAETTALRIKLFLTFATDRMKKFQYELSRPSTERRRAERLNSLLNAYTGCVDDAAELIELGVERQEDIRAGIKEMQTKGKEFLAQLEQLAAGGPELESYKENLRDAIEATKEALQDADKAAKEIAPGPVRRKN
jgi:hypothetical protein